MKQIPDDQWESIFLAGEKRKEAEDKRLFEDTLMKQSDTLFSIGTEAGEVSQKSGSVFERKIPKSMSIEIDATLDLHMKTKKEAFTAISGFIQNSMNAGDRTVLVITGKGHHSDGKGVLRKFVKQWFYEEGRKWILWFSKSPKQLGGSGAWVVRLKR